MLTAFELDQFNADCRAADSVYDGERPEPLTGRLERPRARRVASTYSSMSFRSFSSLPGLTGRLGIAVAVALIVCLGIVATIGAAPRDTLASGYRPMDQRALEMASDET